jgi:hypothetical protein
MRATISNRLIVSLIFVGFTTPSLSIHRPIQHAHLSVRGGSDRSARSFDADYYRGDPPTSYPSRQQQFDDDDEFDPMHETVQNRVDSWRQQQQAMSSTLQESPRDDQGRIKLLTSVSKGARAILFLVCMFRDVSQGHMISV